MRAILEQLDEAIIQGKIAETRIALKKISATKIPREHIFQVANLSRRCGFTALGIRLLNPLVRPTGKSLLQATDEEKAEYAALLTYIGASEEAVELLRTISAEKHPNTLLYKAFSLFSQWDYKNAIGLLDGFILSRGISDYQRLVGRTNLMAALIYERQSERAKSMILGLLEDTKHGFRFLHGNALELAAQLAISNEDWWEADAYLTQAEAHLSDGDSFNKFLVDKWKTVRGLLSSKGKIEWVAQMDRIRKKARELSHWETLRDCDRYQAICLKDVPLFLKLYFGTPYASFRERIIREFGSLELPSQFEWKLGNKTNAARLDISKGSWKEKNASLRVGQLPHRLLIELTRDLYRPLRVAVVHYRLYPNEKFHPLYSPAKVYEAVYFLRRWFRRTAVPLDVVENRGFYSLMPKEPIILVLDRSEALGCPIHSHCSRLRSKFETQPFSVSQGAKHLGISKRSALRLLNGGMEMGLPLKRTGLGPQTRYHFTAKEKAGPS